MRTFALALALAALVPAMAGPLRAAEAGALVLALCNGGSVSVPAGGHDPAGGPPQGPCCAKGCHAGDRRKPLDRKQ